MKRAETGRYEVTSVGGESVRAFLPAPLPSALPLDFSNRLFAYDRYLAILNGGTEAP